MITKPGLGFRIAIVLALLILICFVSLASANNNTSILNNHTVSAGNSSQSIIVPSSSQTPVTTTQDKKTSEDPILALKLYRQNLTYPRNKIPENLLHLIDPNYPNNGISSEQVRSQLIASRLLIPSDKAESQFNLTTINGQLVGDQIFLTVHVYPNASTHILDPVVTEVSTRQEELHGVEAWVDVNNLERLAALNEVQGMKLVGYAEHSGDSVNQTLPTLSSPVSTQKTPISSCCIFSSLICAGFLSLLIPLKKRRI